MKDGFFNDSTKGLLYLVNLMDGILASYPDTTFYPPVKVRVPTITLPCYTSNPDSLPSGTYKFSNTQPHPINSFSSGLITYIYREESFSNYNFRYPDIKKGILTLDHICENTYTISMNATLEDGGRFQGSVSTNLIR